MRHQPFWHHRIITGLAGMFSFGIIVVALASFINWACQSNPKAPATPPPPKPAPAATAPAAKPAAPKPTAADQVRGHLKNLMGAGDAAVTTRHTRSTLKALRECPTEQANACAAEVAKITEQIGTGLTGSSLSDARLNGMAAALTDVATLDWGETAARASALYDLLAMLVEQRVTRDLADRGGSWGAFATVTRDRAAGLQKATADTPASVCKDPPPDWPDLLDAPRHRVAEACRALRFLDETLNLEIVSLEGTPGKGWLSSRCPGACDVVEVELRVGSHGGKKTTLRRNDRLSADGDRYVYLPAALGAPHPISARGTLRTQTTVHAWLDGPRWITVDADGKHFDEHILPPTTEALGSLNAQAPSAPTSGGPGLAEMLDRIQKPFGPAPCRELHTHAGRKLTFQNDNGDVVFEVRVKMTPPESAPPLFCGALTDAGRTALGCAP